MGLSVRGRCGEAKREMDWLFACLKELKSPTTFVTPPQNESERLLTESEAVLEFARTWRGGALHSAW
jgi:hypothetical protein